MNILFLSRWFPFPSDNGSKLRIGNLLRGLAKQHTVTLLSFTDQSTVNLESPEVRSISSDVHVVPWREFNPKSRRAISGFLSSKPRSVVDTHSIQMEHLVRRTVSKSKFDIVIASQLSMASYHRCFRGIPALFEEIELGIMYDQAYRMGSRIKRLRSRLTWFKFRKHISRLLDSFKAFTVASERERQLFISSFPRYQDKIEIMPNCIDLKNYKDLGVKPKPERLIFSGSFTYNVNFEAMNWFVREVYPRIQERIPDVELVISGDHANKPLPLMTNIIMAGYVDDIKSLIASSSVSVAPIWTGGGTRLKILEAMAIGVPVVATSKGAEGLDAQDGVHLLIADSPDAFARSVIKILTDKKTRDFLCDNASRFVKNKYEWSVVMPRFMKLIETVADG